MLIYGGLFAVGVGYALQRTGERYGWAIVGGGGVAVIAGIALIWVRSRRSEP